MINLDLARTTKPCSGSHDENIDKTGCGVLCKMHYACLCFALRTHSAVGQKCTVAAPTQSKHLISRFPGVVAASCSRTSIICVCGWHSLMVAVVHGCHGSKAPNAAMLQRVEVRRKEKEGIEAEVNAFLGTNHCACSDVRLHCSMCMSALLCPNRDM